MKTLFFLLLCLPLIGLSQNLTSTTNINITKSWPQEPDGYTYPMNIKVPVGSAPANGFPVCILLHGNGGNGAGSINQFGSVLECHALVAPTGYLNSWNICSEASDAPDMEMIHDLIHLLQGYSNIDPNKIRIIGSSNGAGLANNIFIENNHPEIDMICAIVSHLNEPQYHSGGFYVPSSNDAPSNAYCGYDSLVNPITSRKYLSISNDNDPIIPYAGGTSVVGVDFLPAETAAFYIAQNNGYTGDQLMAGTTMGNPQITEYSYLSGEVVHIKGNAAHSANTTQRNYIKDFFSDCEMLVSTNDDLPINKAEVYPNPTNATITITGFSERTKQYAIFNILGQEVMKGSISQEVINIDLSELASNIYFLKINDQIIRIIRG